MTGMRVQLASSSARTLPCRGSRCCTRTNAIPVSVGRFLSSSEKASSPPADAPMPTINPQDGGAAGAPSPVRSSSRQLCVAKTSFGPDERPIKGGSGADRILLKRETMKVHGPALDTSQPAFRWPLVRGRDHHSVLALVLPLQTQLP